MTGVVERNLSQSQILKASKTKLQISSNLSDMILLVFMSGSRIFLPKEFWLNVPVAMFFWNGGLQ